MSFTLRGGVRLHVGYIQPAMFDLELESTMGGGGGKRRNVLLSHPQPSHHRLLALTPLVQISFSLQPSSAI